MGNAVEEEEFGDDKGAHEHDETGGNDGEEGDDVNAADDVEDDVTGAVEIALEEGHGGGGLWWFFVGETLVVVNLGF